MCGDFELNLVGLQWVAYGFSKALKGNRDLNSPCRLQVL